MRDFIKDFSRHFTRERWMKERWRKKWQFGIVTKRMKDGDGVMILSCDFYAWYAFA